MDLYVFPVWRPSKRFKKLQRIPLLMKKRSPVKTKQQKAKRQPWHVVPLKGSFMIMAILGFFISAYLVYPKNTNYGATFMLLFGLMFIASLISMTKAPVADVR